MEPRRSRDEPLGFDWDGWFERLVEAEAEPGFGTLGPYQLLGEVGRGSQGVVFRARQPGTGRDIAVKRLLDGSFASPAALRRFEREVDAATALNHPGIVAVFGFELVDGSPLLAMEWVEGLPLTRWSAGKSRAEILAQFLLVCDAVQHAHQRGVLHRDLKPTNVLVDRDGRPRILDFGLAKRTEDTSSTITSSGEFLGTPAYAAPEQWRGEGLDVRADVFSLGALLFEMLTGRRLVEGDALAVMAHALETRATPRPSSVAASIPRELDHIVLQAVASEREARYQSVDALSADVRRFQRGDPVLAHPPGTIYLLRKLVARNRLASALLAALVLATVGYVAAAKRDARQLARERDRALEAGKNEKLAREAADDQRERAEEEQRRADEQRANAERERARAQIERDRAEALLAFLSDDVLGAVDPALLGRNPQLVDIILFAAGKAKARFSSAPEAEARMHAMLGHGLAALGQYEHAEKELREGLSGPDADPADLSSASEEIRLGQVLTELGRFDEAEDVLLGLLGRCEALSREEAALPASKAHWAKALNQLAFLSMKRGRYAESLELMERSIALTEDPQELQRKRANVAILLGNLGRHAEALALQEQDLAALIASRGENDSEVGSARACLGLTLLSLGDAAGAETQLRRAVEIEASIFGPEHSSLVVPMGHLALTLLELKKDYEEAEELARRAVAIAEAATPDGPSLGFSTYCLGVVLEARHETAEAAELQRRSLRAVEELQGFDSDDWSIGAEALVRCLVRLNEPDEARELLDRLAVHPKGPSPAWMLLWKGQVLVLRGQLVEAALWFEDGIATLEWKGDDILRLRAALGVQAKVLRELDAVDEALAVERRLAELGGEPNGLEPDLPAELGHVFPEASTRR